MWHLTTAFIFLETETEFIYLSVLGDLCGSCEYLLARLCVSVLTAQPLCLHVCPKA